MGAFVEALYCTLFKVDRQLGIHFMIPAMLDIYSFIPLICLKVPLLTVNQVSYYFNFSFFYFVKSLVIN